MPPPQPPGQGESPRWGDVVGQTALRFATHAASTTVNVSRSHRAIDCWLALLRKILTLTTDASTVDVCVVCSESRQLRRVSCDVIWCNYVSGLAWEVSHGAIDTKVSCFSLAAVLTASRELHRRSLMSVIQVIQPVVIQASSV